MTETDKVLLCGSIPGDFADEAMTLASRIADLVPAIPDGETGDRSRWVIFQAYRVFDGHPQIETLNRPKPGPGKPDWVPAPFPEGLEEFWTFRIRDNVTDVQFPNLLYASMAERSYETFVSLRQQGKIPDTVRFQVSLPLPESGYSWFFPDAGDLERISRPYEQAMIAELEQILNSIPHHDLAIQWDVCYEVLDIEGAFPWSRPSDPFKRYQETVSRIGPCVPEQVQMGYHLCWGDLGHQHLKEPDDLALAVRGWRTPPSRGRGAA